MLLGKAKYFISLYFKFSKVFDVTPARMILFWIKKYHVRSILFLVGFFIISFGFSQVSETEKKDETLEKGIQILKKYFYDGNNWHIAQPSVEKDVKGLIHFIEDEPVDSIIQNINNILKNLIRGMFIF